MKKQTQHTKRNIQSKTTAVVAVAAVTGMLGACSSAADRLSSVGKAPNLTQIQNPTERPGYRRVAMPMPQKDLEERKPNSLWDASRTTFFKDQRASEVGDILTVMIEIDDEAEMENESTRTRANTEDMGMGQVLGLQSYLGKVLPDAVDPTNLLNAESQSNSSGAGTIERDEEIKLKIAATIIDVMPNGNLVIYGRQEVRVNFEVRELELAGVIRPEDIMTNNTIGYEKIAEARISYGGRGHITDVQQPRYGQQVFDILMPF